MTVEDKFDSSLKSKTDCDSSLIADIIEREQNCNSSNSNNSGYSGELIFELNFKIKERISQVTH